MDRAIKSHIVTRALIENFAVRGQVRAQDVVTGATFTAHTKKVGAHTDFYARTDWNGRRTQETEHALEPIETAVGSLLSEIPNRWPLPASFRTEVAEFIAVQTVRSPGLRKFDEQQLRKRFDEERLRILKDRGLNDLPGRFADLRGDQVLFSAPAFRDQRMLGLIDKAASVFASMHWALLEFAPGSLGLSDQPVVALPGERLMHEPSPPAFDSGLLNVEEVRFPITPTAALLLTWNDGLDSRGAMDADIAGNINAFTKAQAYRHWMHRPDFEPPVSGGVLPLIATQVYEQHRLGGFREARRWQMLNASIQARLGKDPSGYIESVTVTPDGSI